MGDMKDDVDAVTALLRSLLDRKTLTSLQQSVDHLNDISQAIAATTGKLTTIDPNTERASGHLDPLLLSGGDMVRDLRTRVVPVMKQDLADFKPLLKASHDSVGMVQTEILPRALNALETLDELSSTIKDLAVKVDRDPSIVIGGSTPRMLGPGESK
jgi:phospholipid/cholesterol/gamma-HCH transport system substrate-binding protein